MIGWNVIGGGSSGAAVGGSGHPKSIGAGRRIGQPIDICFGFLCFYTFPIENQRIAAVKITVSAVVHLDPNFLIVMTHPNFGGVYAGGEVAVGGC